MKEVISIAAILIGLESALFFSISNFGLTPKTIAELSTSKWDYNPDIVKDLANQSAGNWAGVVLLVLSIVAQLAALMFPPDRQSTIDMSSIGWSVAISTVIFIIFLMIYKKKEKGLARETKKILESSSQ